MKRIVIVAVLLGVSFLMPMAYLNATQKEDQDKQAEMDKAKKEVADELKTYLDELRPPKGYHEKTLQVTDILKKVDASVALEILKPYENDFVWLVRANVYSMGFEIIKPNKDIKIRQEMTNRLVKGLNDPDAYVKEHVGKYILFLPSANFTDDAKKLIHQLLTAEKPGREEVLACGVADMKEEMKRLEVLLTGESADENLRRPSGVWWGSIWWASRLARARMGSKSDIKHCIELVESYEETTRVSNLLHQLSYVRQPEVVELLQKYLNSDKRLPRVKETAPGSLYASYVMAYLAEMLDDFPIKNEGARESRAYSEKEIKQIREWMSEQKEWKFIR